MRVMLRVKAALHIRKVLLILALKRSFESLRSASTPKVVVRRVVKKVGI